MKQMNSPGRKNIRRIEALYRMKKRSALTDIPHQGIDETEAVIMDQDEAESIRTKKDRTSR